MTVIFKNLLEQHVKGEYGQWLLVELKSGRWSPVWYAFADLENEFAAIVNEDKGWFSSQITFEAPESFAAKVKALQKIISSIEKEKMSNPSMAKYLDDGLIKARHALSNIEK